MIALYWDIGKLIFSRQKLEGWGAGVIPRLAKDIKNELPELKGFSERNIKFMVQLFKEYESDAAIGKQAVSQLENVKHLVSQLPWGHNILLMQRIKEKAVRIWYIDQTIQNGWSRDILGLMIKNAVHLRKGNAVTNFNLTLPDPQSDLAQQSLKDPYIFDFLTLTEPFKETFPVCPVFFPSNNSNYYKSKNYLDRILISGKEPVRNEICLIFSGNLWERRGIPGRFLESLGKYGGLRGNTGVVGRVGEFRKRLINRIFHVIVFYGKIFLSLHTRRYCHERGANVVSSGKL